MPSAACCVLRAAPGTPPPKPPPPPAPPAPPPPPPTTTTTTQVTSTVLASALGYKMICYLEAHRRDQDETPSLRSRKVPLQSLTDDASAAENPLLDPLYRPSDELFGGMDPQAMQLELERSTTGGTPTTWRSSAVDTTLKYSDASGFTKQSEASTAALTRSSGSFAGTGGDKDDVDDGLSATLLSNESTLYSFITGALVLSIIPEVAGFILCYPWASEVRCLGTWSDAARARARERTQPARLGARVRTRRVRACVRAHTPHAHGHVVREHTATHTHAHAVTVLIIRAHKHTPRTSRACTRPHRTRPSLFTPALTDLSASPPPKERRRRNSCRLPTVPIVRCV